MESQVGRTVTIAVLFLLGVFGTPVHLLVDVHEWSHHESPEPDDHEHSHHEPHPAADHQLDQVSPGIRPLPGIVDIVFIDFQVLQPDVQTGTPTVEAEANSPPSSPESPPRCPRAPPL